MELLAVPAHSFHWPWLGTHKTGLIHEYIHEQYIEKYNNLISEDCDHQISSMAITGCIHAFQLSTWGSDAPNHFILPFWNWLVKQEDHDPDQHLLSMILNEPYCDRRIEFSYRANSTLTRAFNGIIRNGYFFTCTRPELKMQQRYVELFVLIPR